MLGIRSQVVTCVKQSHQFLCVSISHDMRSVFGNRSVNTVLKRGNSMVRFITWFRGSHMSWNPFPLQPADIDAYMTFLFEQGAGASAFSGLLEALKFCYCVLGIGEGPIPISLRAKKHVELADLHRQEKKQARVLTVREVRGPSRKLFG